MLPKGELLFAGVTEFAAAAGTGIMRVLNIPPLPGGLDDQYLLTVRNGSEAEDLLVDVGHCVYFQPYRRNNQKRIAVTAANTGDLFTSATPHNFKVNDRLVFEGTGGGVTANLYYYVITNEFLTATTFQVSATPGGSLQALNANAANVCDVVGSKTSSDVIYATGVVATDVYTSKDSLGNAVPHGFTIGDCIEADVAVDIIAAMTKYYIRTIPSATTFTLGAARGTGVTVINVGATDLVTFHVECEYASLTSFTVPKFAASSFTANVAGIVTKVIQGWPFGGDQGGRLTFSPGTDGTYTAFAATVEIRRA